MVMTRDGIYFKDEFGRVRILRGVNLSGTTKLPITPNGATHLKEGFYNQEDISFVGRPFPLDAADEHFGRLKSWGLEFLRFLITWEAIEHQAPDVYDHDYLDYVSAIIDKAAEYGMTVFVDFHQDVWSRFSGGDGAPAWTFEKVGMEIQNFEVTKAALLHQFEGDDYMPMSWASNYSKLAAATMFTLFYAGNDFAPNLQIDGQSAQDYLQKHYFSTMHLVAQRLKGKPNVIGYDFMNEPSKGFIGLTNLATLEWDLKTSYMPTPFQAMLLGAGIPQEIEKWKLGFFGMRKLGKEWVDPKGVSIWKAGVEPLWKAHGVWDYDDNGQPILLKPDYFQKVNGKKVTFEKDYMKPFITEASRKLHETVPDTMSFVQFDAVGRQHVPVWEKEVAEEQKIVYAPHWYPFILLMSRHYASWIGLDAVNSKPVFGREEKRETFANNLKYHMNIAQNSFHGVPTVIGEIGIPYDLNDGEGFRGNWDNAIRAIDDNMYALEKNMLNYTIWNYSPNNTNEYGDLWNKEDLSIFSYDQQDDPSDINSGGRGLMALIRPYAKAIAGIPQVMEFDLLTGIFTFEYIPNGDIEQPTEIYVPTLQYPDGFDINVTGGVCTHDADSQTLFINCDAHTNIVTLEIQPRGFRDVFEEDPQRLFVTLLMALSGIITPLLLYLGRNQIPREVDVSDES
ncbi:MAG: cellulase family glycosylhydrolase [Phototrophicaceae bacterium]